MQLVCCLRFHLLPEVPQDEFFLPTLYNVHQHDGNLELPNWVAVMNFQQKGILMHHVRVLVPIVPKISHREQLNKLFSSQRY